MTATGTPHVVRLQVEPTPRDHLAGHGAPAGVDVGLDPDVADRLGLGCGDAVELVSPAGQRRIARVARADAAPQAASGAVRLDLFARRSLGVHIGSDVAVERVTPVPASRIEVSLPDGPAASEGHLAELARELTGSVVSTGAVVGVAFGGWSSHRPVRIEVISAGQGEPVVSAAVTAATTLAVSSADAAELGAAFYEGFEQVGGLETQSQALREIVQLAVERPEVHRLLGIRPQRGVILHGPPGTGKTLLCRALAQELDAHFFYVSGPEVVGTSFGETEQTLRSIFSAAAEEAPSIICIDEIEAIARNRSELSSQADLRAVAQLLALMDGLRRFKGVYVVGTTNQLTLVDEAFRRPGRFDREIYVGEPDEAGRLAILQVHTRRMPLSSEARDELSLLAAETAGFVGADLAGLCHEAGMSAFRRLVASGGVDAAMLALERGDCVGPADMHAARAALRPALTRDRLLRPVTGPAPELVGLDEPLAVLERAAGEALRTDGSAVAGSRRRGVLLTGPTGAGKTAVAATLAERLQVALVAVDGPELVSRWSGDTEASIRRLVDLATRSRPAILLLDHLEALAPRLAATGIGSRSAEDARAVAQLCSVLDTVITQPGVFVIGATSRPELVDETVLFAGRLGLRVTLPLPGAGARTTLLAGLLAERAATGLTAQEIAFAAERAEGCSAAELALVADLYTAPAAATAGHVPAIERLLRIVDGLGSRWVLARDRAVDAAEDHVERSAR